MEQRKSDGLIRSGAANRREAKDSNWNTIGYYFGEEIEEDS
jgi:hypothetical protein